MFYFMTITHYYNEITTNYNDMEYINWCLNRAIRDDEVKSISLSRFNFTYLCTVANSLGFRFGKHFNLI